MKCQRKRIDVSILCSYGLYGVGKHLHPSTSIAHSLPFVYSERNWCNLQPSGWWLRHCLSIMVVDRPSIIPCRYVYIYIYVIECHPMPVTASSGFPCLEKKLGEHKQINFLGCQSSQFQGFFGKRWFWFWVCNILDLPFWIPCCILCVALSTAMNCWMSLQCFWLAKIAYDFVSGEACIFLSNSLTVSYLLLLGLRFPPAAWCALVCWKRFSWTEVFFMSHHAWCSVPKA